MDIWFDLCVGDIRTTERGNQIRDINHSREVRISSYDNRNVQFFKDQLITMLKDSVDWISEDQKRSKGIKELRSGVADDGISENKKTV